MITDENFIKEELKEFEKWEKENGFIPSGKDVKSAIRPVKKGEFLYEMIKKTNPVAQELLEKKSFRDDFQKFRKRNRIDTSVTYQNIKNYFQSCNKRKENKISNFLDNMLNKYHLSGGWKDSLRTYLFLYNLPPPLFHTIWFKCNPKKRRVSISFTSKKVSKKDLLNFIEFQWGNIKKLKDKYLKAEKDVDWKDDLRTRKFAFFLKETGRVPEINKIKEIVDSDLLELEGNGLKRYSFNEESLEKCIREYKKRYWK